MEVTKWLKPSNSGPDLVTARVCEIKLVYSLGNLHFNAFDNDTGGHVFPKRDQ
jgi:hypothetical protein